MTETPKLRALLVDDEAAARLALTKRLQAVSVNVEVCGEASNGKDALALIDTLAPNVVFLDVSMPGPTGFDVARKLTGEEAPLVVFLTAYGDRAIEAFETEAIDYVTKPVAADRIERCIQRVLQELEKRRKLNLSTEFLSAIANNETVINQALASVNMLNLNVGGGVARVREEDVLYIEAAGEYACVHTTSETFVVRESLKHFENQLLSDKFYRIHRQTIVNIEKVERVSSDNGVEHKARLTNGKEFPISRRNVTGLKKVLTASPA
ncbi:LytTR family DNA-binding domain-containing protein [Hyphococcus flavus]|uniref:LytTR family DNA-binding domain-containing protein n=1 Tax=Hyphococcus flavus TaxID=1866326 RepID=A0AAF0CEW3_9PROT|nr:LytTR family DNA-binding domain-containing protein [Hyphococcus flavus]WDI30163.1 LytTR family DNA-binding domain-containing protein [Hyphococcus flavus]